MAWKGHTVRELLRADLESEDSGFLKAIDRFRKKNALVPDLNSHQALKKIKCFDRIGHWDGCKVFVVLNPAGSIVSTATVFAVPTFRSLLGHRVGIIESVATIETEEGHSYGRAAVEECLDWLRSVNVAIAELYCENEKVSYYGAMGFYRVGPYLRMNLPHSCLKADGAFPIDSRDVGKYQPVYGQWAANGRVNTWASEGHPLQASVMGCILPTFLHGGECDIAFLEGVHVPFGQEVDGKKALSGCIDWMNRSCYRVGVWCEDKDERMFSLYQELDFEPYQNYMRKYL